jgi:hypothetical protein
VSALNGGTSGEKIASNPPPSAVFARVRKSSTLHPITGEIVAILDIGILLVNLIFNTD